VKGLGQVKAWITIWNDEKKEVEHGVELDVRLEYYYDWTHKFWFWLEGKCPYCGEKVGFDLIAEGDVSKSLEEEIEEIAQDEEHYTEGEIKDFLKKVETIVKYYTDYPSETEPAGKCIHFNPSEYYSEKEFEEMGVDMSDVLVVESGVATVDINDVIRILIDEMKGGRK
jgi:hypothetical protein